MKCPICNSNMITTRLCDGIFPNLNKGKIDEIFCDKCKMHGTEELWQELIDLMKEYDLCYDALIERTKEVDHTRKALSIAVDTLKDIDKTRSVANHKIGTQDKTLNSGIVFCWATPDEIHNALEQITALEQKDVK